MQKRTLGRTGHDSTLVIFGGAALWEISQEDANAALDMAINAGVNHIDVAPQYGQAEMRVGGWIAPHRDNLFLASKTMEREHDASWAQLQTSLELLKTDHLDLYQLHAITEFEQLDAALASGGAIETLQRARDEGLTKSVGITGHGNDAPEIFVQALERFDFDTVMFPVNPLFWADANFRKHAEKLLQLCTERNVGVMAIKSIAKQAWGNKEKSYNTWYEPYDQQAMIDKGVAFALSQPGVTAIPAAGDTRLLPMVIDAAERFTPMSAENQAAFIAQSENLAPIFA